jgi:hypothetical protein
MTTAIGNHSDIYSDLYTQSFPEKLSIPPTRSSPFASCEWVGPRREKSLFDRPAAQTGLSVIRRFVGISVKRARRLRARIDCQYILFIVIFYLVACVIILTS